MWAPLLFMVPSGRRLLRGSGQEPGRLPRPAPGSTQCRPLHLRPPGGGEGAGPRKPRASRCAARVRCRGARGEGRRPAGPEAQVPSTSAEAEAARRCPQVRRPGRGRSLGRLLGILARVASCGAAPRDRRRGPLGKGGAAALLLGLPLSLSRCFPPAERGLRPRSGATSFRSATRLPPL